MSTDNQRIAGKVPPNDLDAERAVISAALLDAGAADVVVSMLVARSFFSVQHQQVFRAIQTLSERDKSIDVLVVAAQLRSDGVLAEVGGAGYLAQLIDATPAVSHVDEHCQIVANLARQRQLVALSHEIVAEGYQPHGDVPSWLGSVEGRILDATATGHRRDIVPLRSILTEVSQDHMADQGSDGDRVETGHVELDRDSGGLYAGDLVVVAARPGMGKSALVQGIARNVASTGQHVALFSLEMPRKQVAHRLIAQTAGVRLNAVRDPHNNAVTHREHELITNAMAHLATLPIRIDDTPGIMIPELRSKVRRIAAQARAKGTSLGLVIVDYLQIMGRSRRSRSREEEVAADSYALKSIGMELGVPVIACAQLNRMLEQRQDKRPMLADLRESGAVEQAADQVWFVYRDALYSSSAESNRAELIIGKNRNGGEAMTVDVGWDGWCTRFVDWSER